MMTGCAWCNVGPEDECEMDCITRTPGWVDPPLVDKAEGCPDGGVCGHACDSGPCWRVAYCGPFSNVFPNDEWPEEIKRQNGVEPSVASGAQMIATERQRQIEAEGWTPEHDDEHDGSELRYAAIAYAQRALAGAHPIMNDVPDSWPWENRFWKPSNDPIRNLVKAGALIAAEIDRLQRREGQLERQRRRLLFTRTGKG